MTSFIQDNNFRNPLDLKGEILNITQEFYPTITMEKEVETREEYKRGCRETDIRTLVGGDNFYTLLDRIANFINERQTDDFKRLMIDFIVDNNLVDDEELR